MLKKLTTFWRILLPILLVMLTSLAVLTHKHTEQELDSIELQAKEKADSVVQLLSVSQTLEGEQASSSMLIFIDNALKLGSPRIDGVTYVDGKTLPSLSFGEHRQNYTYELVDQISVMVPSEATLFVKTGSDFVRVATTIRLEDGNRAVGTLLDSSGKAFAALNQGKPYQGLAYILDRPYVSYYEPIRDDSGQLIGAYFVGNALDFGVVSKSISKSRFLKSGYIALFDKAKNKLLFASSNAKKTNVLEHIKNPPKNWHFISKEVPDWGINVIVAYPHYEAMMIGLIRSIPIFIGVIALGLLGLSLLLWQYRKHIFLPIGGDPQHAIDLIHSIAEGKLEKDHHTAQPETLMHYVINMRNKLRDMVGELQTSNDRLILSASVFEHAKDGIFIADANQKIIETNPAFTLHSGFTREMALGSSPRELGFVFKDEQFFENLWNRTDSDGIWRGETENLDASGKPYSAWIDLFPIRNEAQAVTQYVGVFSDISTVKQYQENLEHMAYHDHLTGLPNRPLFADRLIKALAVAKRSKELLAVCYFDLDDFKEVNDTLGHEAGDMLLVELAERLREGMRETDTIARMGGDEFALLLCGLSSLEECELTLNRLLARIRVPFELDGHPANVSASIGYTISPLDDAAPETLIRHADQAMYQVKINGGSGFMMFDTESEKIKKHQIQTRDAISTALENREFMLYYQPKVDMRLGKVVGLEALIRWKTQKEIKLPNDFLPQIEHSNLIITLGEWAIGETLKQISLWKDAGLEMPVSVNIAPRHLLNKDFLSQVKALLSAYPQVSPDMLMLEVTESAAIDDISAVTKIMEACRNLGITFALDDFGVGYSSLTYLRRLPVEFIKIDQSFVRDMLDDPEDLALVAGIISLSREFGHQVIAEGVESSQHGVELLKMGCKLAQGFGIAKAMPAAELENWLNHYVPDIKWQQV